MCRFREVCAQASVFYGRVFTAGLLICQTRPVSDNNITLAHNASYTISFSLNAFSHSVLLRECLILRNLSWLLSLCRPLPPLDFGLRPSSPLLSLAPLVVASIIPSFPLDAFPGSRVVESRIFNSPWKLTAQWSLDFQPNHTTWFKCKI